MADFEKLYAGSWYTTTGVGGDINEWKNGYQELLDGLNVGKIKEWVEFTGAEMNAYYGLTDTNAYKDDLHFLAFSLDGLDGGMLAMFKLQMQDRWFDDIVDNNAFYQEKINQKERGINP